MKLNPDEQKGLMEGKGKDEKEKGMRNRRARWKVPEKALGLGFLTFQVRNSCALAIGPFEDSML